jgi:hypothetical protein
MFENSNVNISAFIDVMRDCSANLSSRKLDANQITNYNKGLEKVIELLG